jgi:hypothetical protein
LDQLRSESTELERALDGATQEEQRLREEREEAALRIEAAQAALDSIGAGAAR